jgi:hypothetical protein
MQNTLSLNYGFSLNINHIATDTTKDFSKIQTHFEKKQYPLYIVYTTNDFENIQNVYKENHSIIIETLKQKFAFDGIILLKNILKSMLYFNPSYLSEGTKEEKEYLETEFYFSLIKEYINFCNQEGKTNLNNAYIHNKEGNFEETYNFLFETFLIELFTDSIFIFDQKLKLINNFIIYLNKKTISKIDKKKYIKKDKDITLKIPSITPELLKKEFFEIDPYRHLINICKEKININILYIGKTEKELFQRLNSHSKIQNILSHYYKIKDNNIIISFFNYKNDSNINNKDSLTILENELIVYFNLYSPKDKYNKEQYEQFNSKIEKDKLKDLKQKIVIDISNFNNLFNVSELNKQENIILKNPKDSFNSFINRIYLENKIELSPLLLTHRYK